MKRDIKHRAFLMWRKAELVFKCGVLAG